VELKGTKLEDRDQIPLTGDGNKSQSDECETKQIELGINKTNIYKPVKAILFIMNCMTLKAINCN